MRATTGNLYIQSGAAEQKISDNCERPRRLLANIGLISFPEVSLSIDVSSSYLVYCLVRFTQDGISAVLPMTAQSKGTSRAMKLFVGIVTVGSSIVGCCAFFVPEIRSKIFGLPTQEYPTQPENTTLPANAAPVNTTLPPSQPALSKPAQLPDTTRQQSPTRVATIPESLLIEHNSLSHRLIAIEQSLRTRMKDLGASEPDPKILAALQTCRTELTYAKDAADVGKLEALKLRLAAAKASLEYLESR